MSKATEMQSAMARKEFLHQIGITPRLGVLVP